MDDNNDMPQRAAKTVEAHTRQDRLGRALRENLKRRKAQARSRSAGVDDGRSVAPEGSAAQNDRATSGRDHSD